MRPPWIDDDVNPGYVYLRASRADDRNCKMEAVGVDYLLLFLPPVSTVLLDGSSLLARLTRASRLYLV